MVQVHSRKILLVQVRFGFIDLKFSCRYSFRREKKKGEIVDPVVVHHCSYCACTSVSGIRIWKKYILTFVRGSGSVRVHLSTILRVQVWFGFTAVVLNPLSKQLVFCARAKPNQIKSLIFSLYSAEFVTEVCGANKAGR